MPVTESNQNGQSPAAPSGQGQLPLGSAAPDGQSNPPPAAPPVKPDGLPDRYWDATTGLRTADVTSALAALETESAKTAEAFKDFPAKVEDAGKFYVLPEQMLPEGVNLPDGVKIEPNTELLTAALPILHKHKISRDAFHDLARAFTANELTAFQADATAFAEDRKKLGATADTRIKAVVDGLTGIVGPDKAKFIDPSRFTSQGVEFFEAILAKFSSQSNVVPMRTTPDTPPAPPQSIEQRWYGNNQKAG